MRYNSDMMQNAGVFNQEALEIVRGKAFFPDDTPRVPVHEPEALPTFDPRPWVILGQPLTPIPEVFRAFKVRGRGRGKGRTVCRVDALTHLPLRHAKGLRDQSRNDISLPASIADDAASLSVRDSEASLEQLGAGKAVTGNETSWEELV
jgi:hypothetical protein